LKISLAHYRICPHLYVTEHRRGKAADATLMRGVIL